MIAAAQADASSGAGGDRQVAPQPGAGSDEPAGGPGRSLTSATAWGTVRTVQSCLMAGPGGRPHQFSGWPEWAVGASPCSRSDRADQDYTDVIQWPGVTSPSKNWPGEIPLKGTEVANHSRWEDIKRRRPVPADEVRAGIEHDLALGQLIYICARLRGSVSVRRPDGWAPPGP